MSETVFSIIFLSFILVSFPAITYNSSWKTLFIGANILILLFAMLHSVDFSSFLLKEQENLYCFDMVQGTSVLNCKSSTSLLFVMINHILKAQHVFQSV